MKEIERTRRTMRRVEVSRILGYTYRQRILQILIERGQIMIFSTQVRQTDIVYHLRLKILLSPESPLMQMV